MVFAPADSLSTQKTNQQWDQIAEEIAASKSLAAGKRILRQQAPHLVNELKTIGRQPQLLEFWGRSLNHDENAGVEIVHPQVLRVLSSFVGKKLQGRVMHAGLLHTYGYLLSTIETPYGKKRDRYTDPEVAVGLGFDETNPAEGTLLGTPLGTLLGNLTWCAGQFTLNNSAFTKWKSTTSLVSPAVQQHDFTQIKFHRIHDQYVAASGRSITAITTLVLFSPSRPGPSGPNIAWLVFGLEASRRQLLTTFPVTAATVDQICSVAVGSEWQASCLPYNAFFPGITGHNLEVTRRSVTKNQTLQN